MDSEVLERVVQPFGDAEGESDPGCVVDGAGHGGGEPDVRRERQRHEQHDRERELGGGERRGVHARHARHAAGEHGGQHPCERLQGAGRSRRMAGLKTKPVRPESMCATSTSAPGRSAGGGEITFWEARRPNSRRASGSAAPASSR